MTPPRFLLDQMLDAEVAEVLNREGFHSLRVSALGMARAADDQILAVAIEKGMVLITLDGHFGDWAVLPLKQHAGVIRVKANPSTSRKVLPVLISFLKKHGDTDFKNSLVIISNRATRWVNTGNS